MFLEDGVGVDPPEAERAHRRPAGLWATVDPGPCLAVEVEGRGLELRVARIGMQGRREHLVVQRQRGLDQPRRAGCGDWMADH